MAYKITEIKKDERDAVKDFLVKHYYPYDQVLLATGNEEATVEEVNYVVDILDNELSLKAVTDDGEACGIALNGEVDKNVIKNWRKKIQTNEFGYQFTKILQFYLAWERDTHLWDVIETDKVFTIHVLAVKPTFRRQGIMKALVNASLECAKVHNHKAVTVDCTSLYTARYFQKLEWDCIYAIPYVHFRDSDGKQIFTKKNKPHLHARTYCLSLE